MPRPKSTGTTPQFSFRLDPDVRAALEILAEMDDRSLSSYIERQLKKHVEQVKLGATAEEQADTKKKSVALDKARQVLKIFKAQLQLRPAPNCLVLGANYFIAESDSRPPGNWSLHPRLDETRS